MMRRDSNAKRKRREARAQEKSAMPDEPSSKSDAPATKPAPQTAVATKGKGASVTKPKAAAAAAKQIVDAVEKAPERIAETHDEERETHHLKGAEWARPFAVLDEKWTWFEARMLFVTLLALVSLLCAWIALRGMQDRNSAAGVFFRAIFGMAVLGGLTRYATRDSKFDEKTRTLATLGAVVLGAAAAKSWVHVGNDYFQGVLDWLQQGSSIALFGGLRGISTRLTMMVALVGASLACAAGTHINVDIIIRFTPKPMRKMAHLVAMLGAAAVCLASSYGFFDFIAVSGFHAAPDATLGEKFGAVTEELSGDFFILRKQLSLDVGAVPYVVQGKRWNADERMNGRQWNAFVDEGGFAERYGAEKTAVIKAGPSELEAPRRPFVILPGGTAAGALLEGLNLVFPLGFLMLGLRLILRVLLVLGGYLEPHLEGEGSGDDDTESDDEAPRAEGEVA